MKIKDSHLKIVRLPQKKKCKKTNSLDMILGCFKKMHCLISREENVYFIKFRKTFMIAMWEMEGGYMFNQYYSLDTTDNSKSGERFRIVNKFNRECSLARYAINEAEKVLCIEFWASNEVSQSAFFTIFNLWLEDTVKLWSRYPDDFINLFS